MDQRWPRIRPGCLTNSDGVCLLRHLDQPWHNTYGLTHPFFTFQDVNVNGEGSESTEGQWDGNSAYFDYKVNVDKTGKTFAGKMVLKIVQGPDPYDPNATVLFTGTFNLSATKLGVDKNLLP